MLDETAIAEELLARRQARRSLIAFASEVDIPGAPLSEDDDEPQFHKIETRLAAHHKLLLETLQRVSETPGGRAMVFMPPGSAKSTYASVVFPAWLMGRKPKTQIILASYATGLAKKHGRRTRQLVSSKRYRQIFDTVLSKESSAANEWALDNGSEYMSGGLQSGLTGNRADGLLVDDPVAGREEAESEVLREKTLAAYEDDARTRIKPSGWRAIVSTRWHESDLCGRILPENWNGESGKIMCRDGHYWEVICLPAECDRADDPLGRKIGEGLWPEWFTKGHWDEFKSNPRSWLSLYQQKPTAEQGTYFKREWINLYDHKPTNLTIYLSGDFAVSEGGGDWSELAVWGVDAQNNIYALDWWSGQTTSDAWVNRILEFSAQYKPIFLVAESGVIRKSVEPWLRKEMEVKREYIACEWLPTTGDKPAMARSFQAMCSAHKVHFPKTDWAARAINQLMKFPAGSHDDVVDACGVFGRFIDQTWAAPKLPQKKPLVWDAPITMKEFEAA
jgi:predicted phage terminase large subunit-like protein